MHKISIKKRLMVLALVPIMVIIALSTGRILYDFSIKNSLVQTKERIKEAKALSKVIHFLQIERGLSSGFVASGGTKNGEKLPEIRSKVDGAIIEIKDVFNQTGGDANVLSHLGELEQKRSEVTTLKLDSSQVALYYTKTILSMVDATLNIPSHMEDMQSRNILQSYTHLNKCKREFGTS